MSPPVDPLTLARAAVERLRSGSSAHESHCEISEECEESPASSDEQGESPDLFVRWRLANAARLTSDQLATGLDPGGYCVNHDRPLSYPEQQRGACSWCVTVDPDREPEYCASHWRRFKERS